MILREFAPDAAHQAADRQVEAGGAELPLVVSIRRKIEDFVRRLPMMEYVGHGPIDLGIAAAALLVVKTAPVADTGQYQTMLDAGGFLPVAGQPRDCPDGSR